MPQQPVPPPGPAVSSGSAATDEREQRFAAFLHRAGDLLRADQVASAEREVARALQVLPGDMRALNLLGLVRFRGGRYEEAREVYLDLVREAPDDTAIRLNLGLVELRLGLHADAAQNLEHVTTREPGNQKAQGYLGLALLRSGNLVAARTAFAAGGHTELTRQVEEELRTPRDEAGALVAGGETGQRLALDGDLPLEVAAEARERRGRRARDVRKPMALGALLGERDLPLPTIEEPFLVVDEGRLLVARVEGRLQLRTAGAIASSGRLAYDPLPRRQRGHAGTEAFGDGEDAMLVASGSGIVVLSPRGGRFTALRLVDEDVLYVREGLVAAFEGSLSWESGKVPGTAQVATAGWFAQFRGGGRVVLRTLRLPRALRLDGSEVLYVSEDALVGWTGDVVPMQLRGADGQPTSFVAVSGTGAILVEDPSPAP